MRTLVLGVDSGTQSTKVLVVNARNGSVVGKGTEAYGLNPGLPPAPRNSVHTWREAARQAIQHALLQAKATAKEVAAIGIIDNSMARAFGYGGRGHVTAKLWCDTSTASECDQISNTAGPWR